ncbi:MAG: alginate lyase family protein [Rhizobiaceae bacterium]|nr:alginate lyase family protein [Rhizobiaceae bacterium]
MSASLRRLGLVLLAVWIGLAGAAGAEAPLKPPFDLAKVRAEQGKPAKKKFRCGAVPPSVRSVETESKYAPGTGSTVIDPQRAAVYDKLKNRLRRFTGPVVRLANAYVRSQPADPRIAACAVSWLATWARLDAAKDPQDRRGDAVRAQLLSIVALAYVQVRDEPTLAPDERRTVEAWLRRLASRVQSDYSEGADLPSRRNNHRYWAGWAVMTAAVALDDRQFYDWALSSAELGIDSITADGFLPLELERKQRSLGYHFYAAEPLVLLAETALANGTDLYARNDGAIVRLVERSVAGWSDPADFAARTGIDQDLGFIKNGGKIAWALILAHRFPVIDVAAWHTQYSSFTSLAAGGDVQLLYLDPADKQPDPPAQ